MLTSKEQEILDIMQEECAEVIQAISKVRRFGLDTVGPNGKTNRESLTIESGDLQGLLSLCYQFNILDPMRVNYAMHAKIDKLHSWSNIFKK